MGLNVQEHPRRVFRRIPKLPHACLFLAGALFGFLVAVALLYFAVWQPKLSYLRAGAPSPADLATCTRLEIRYLGGALNHFFPHSPWQETVLNEQERARVRSYDTRTVTDQEQIKALARLLSQDTYYVDLYGGTKTEVIITGYRGRHREVVLPIRGTSKTRERQIVSGSSPDFLSIDPPELQSLHTRWNCCHNLGDLFVTLTWELRRGHVYPDPNDWCDIIAARIRDASSDFDVASLFVCPSAQASFKVDDAHSEAQQTGLSTQTSGTWISTYAMNPNCRKNSPPDTVFLFESKPDWNQHGGPELFTFDNHDPKGGLVRLNDGKVKFIRAEEELKQLRW